MENPLEGFVGIVITLLLLLVLPIFIKASYYDVSERNQIEYEADRLSWKIETTRTLDLNEVEQEFTLKCYTSQGVSLEYAVIGNIIHIPTHARYVSLEYAEERRWSILE